MKLNQNSTWRGLTAIIGAAAMLIGRERSTVIVPAILALIGAINVVRES